MGAVIGGTQRSQQGVELTKDDRVAMRAIPGPEGH